MGTLILRNIGMPDSSRADILIEGGVIRRILRRGGESPAGEEAAVMRQGDAEEVDCAGMTAMPGFVNMHTHAAMSLMRGVGEDVRFHQWLETIWRLESEIDAEYVRHGSRAACLEMIKTGTTTFNNHYWYAPDAFDAVSDLGIRPVESYVFIDKFDQKEAQRQKEEFIRTYEKSLEWPEGSFTVGIHSIYSVSAETIRWAADFARDHGLRIHIHLSETEKEVRDCIRDHGMSPVEYLESLGLLGPDLIAAHTLWVSEKDIELLGKRHVNCVHNINSNLKLASGYRFLYNELRDAGANVCIGTDGCASSNNLDILEAMKTASIVQKAWRGDPSAMPLDELLAMATANGAKALGLNTGRLEEGCDADILIVDTGSTFFLSPGTFLANFVYSAHSDCIDSVLCRGRFVMRHRKVEGEEKILDDARRTVRKFAIN